MHVEQDKSSVLHGRAPNTEFVARAPHAQRLHKSVHLERIADTEELPHEFVRLCDAVFIMCGPVVIPALELDVDSRRAIHQGQSPFRHPHHILLGDPLLPHEPVQRVEHTVHEAVLQDPLAGSCAQIH